MNGKIDGENNKLQFRTHYILLKMIDNIYNKMLLMKVCYLVTRYQGSDTQKI